MEDIKKISSRKLIEQINDIENTFNPSQDQIKRLVQMREELQKREQETGKVKSSTMKF